MAVEYRGYGTRGCDWGSLGKGGLVPKGNRDAPLTHLRSGTVALEVNPHCLFPRSYDRSIPRLRPEGLQVFVWSVLYLLARLGDWSGHPFGCSVHPLGMIQHGHACSPAPFRDAHGIIIMLDQSKGTWHLGMSGCCPSQLFGRLLPVFLSCLLFPSSS